MFLRHEGFLGALGAFKSYEKHGLGSLMGHHLSEQSPVASPRPQLEQKSNGPLLVESTDAESVGCCILGSDTMKRT